jgi:pyruvate/oxaloacetate carboxyltransferase
LYVIAGERYKIVLNKIKAYVLGKYGRVLGIIDKEVKEKIIMNNPSSEKTIDSYLSTKEECTANGLCT